MVTSVAHGQCNGTDVTEAGLFCDEAPILCQIECLDGFTGTLPDELIMPQPMSLCDGGEPNNLSWFAFVAGSDSINLTLIPSNCNDVPIDTTFTYDTTFVDGDVIDHIDTLILNILYNTGVQAGIYSSCDFDDEDREIVCSVDCNDVVADINLASGDFVLGQVYYLLVDGCAGSVCDYEVQLNYGEQAFEMPEITTISNQYNIDFANDTICAGATIDITLDDLDLDVSFEWSLSPATAEYPDGLHPVTDTNTVEWMFSEPGMFEICVFAENFCDANDTVCFNVMVDTIADEYFTEIAVCQECFPLVLATSDTTCIMGANGEIIPTILTEDPNGDGIGGWFGFTPVMGPGLFSNEVGTMYGCTYHQYVNVVSVPIKPRESVTLYRCAGDFPFDYHGESITGPVTDRFVTIDNAADTGCDSLVSLTVFEYGQEATIAEGNCQDGGIVLHFDLGTELPAGSIVSYEWQFGGSTITDTDGIDTTMLATASGFYAVVVSLTIDGVDCSFTRGSGFVDIDDVTPIAPEFGMIPTDICNDGEPVILWVEDQNQLVEYQWDLVPSLPFLYGATSDTIYVDVTGNAGFQYCVIASNDCGESMEICDVMSVASPPTVDIVMPEAVCIDTLATVVYEGDAQLTNATFVWDFGGGSLMNTADINGAGPHEVVFTSEGFYTVSVSVSQGVCESISYTQTIEVLPPFALPEVECEASSEQVEFTLDGNYDPTMTTVTLVSPTDATLVFDADKLITVSDVANNTEVVVEVSYQTMCGEYMDQLRCTTNDCSTLDLTLMLEAPNGTCTSASGLQLSAVAMIDGQPTTIGEWSGPNIDENGVISAGSTVGTFTVEYSVVDGSCVYTEDLDIFLYQTPTLSFDIERDGCDPSEGVTIQLSSDVPGTFALDGEESTDGIYNGIQAGIYSASITTEEGCTDELVVDVEVEEEKTISVMGESLVAQGSPSTWLYVTEGVVEDVGILWLVNGQTLCQNEDCESFTYVPSDGDELCVVAYLDEECFIEDCVSIETYFQVDVHMPNVFSPNGDGNNDTFYPLSNDPDLQIAKMLIYDRWGNCVFSEAQVSMGEENVHWDGTYNGVAVEPGVYIYIVDYIDSLGNLKRITGDLTLVK